jgi:hypothetical protein
MIKFSKANAKIEALMNVPELQEFLENDRKVYSFDLLSGHSCPFAEKCLSKVIIDENGKRKIQDGPKTEFRCFSASQEVQYTNVYNLRKANFVGLRNLTLEQMIDALQEAMPKNLGICRIHVAGDFFNSAYFEAWVTIAQNNPDRLFYAYTKSIKYWTEHMENNGFPIDIPDNFILTASRGGRLDHMISEHNLRESVVVFSEEQAENLGLDIDHDDSHAADPSIKNRSFALLIHGTQPKGSEAADAVKVLKKKKVKHSYSRVKS